MLLRLAVWRLVYVILFGVLIAGPAVATTAVAQDAQAQKALAGDQNAAEPARTPLPGLADPAQAREAVARMSDQEVRSALLQYLQSLDRPAEAKPAEPVSLVFELQAAMYAMRNRMREMIAAIPDLPSIGPFMVMRITKGYDPSHIWAIGGYLLLIFSGALLGELALRRLFRPVVRQLSGLPARSEFGALGMLLLRALIGLFAVAAFAASAAVLFLFVYKGHEVARIAFWSILGFVIFVRVGAVCLELLLSLRRPDLRLPDVDDATARHLYVSFLSLFALAAGSLILTNFLQHIGVAPGHLLAAGEILLLFNVLAQIAIVWTQRARIARLIGSGVAGAPGATVQPRGIETLLSRNWHIFAVALLVFIAVTSTINRLVTGTVQGVYVLPTLGVLVALPLLDGLLRMVVRQFFGKADPDPGGPASAAGAEHDARRRDDYGRVILRNGRIVLLLLGAIVLADIWNLRLEAIAPPGLGAHIAGSLFDIVVTLVLASAGWGIIKTAINRQLPHEGLDALAMADGDIGGTGLSRLETLLPLLRKFVFIALLVVVAMIVISSLGINIGPLLAGAGVVGIAVGFGAQTLVRDVISGIFFLIDDAFRVGEYIDVGEGKGTVERMSVRALMLRHHLGQINTIPFGVIRRVTNFSRDWVIMKLETRVPYNTDLEKLRKLVKRVGVEMMDDPTYGENFIQPVKSQGVHHMDDSSFVIRVKFMAKPGEQFVLRREVFRRLQEAFHAEGIKFAPRRVIVEAEGAPAAGAAAAAATAGPGEGEGRAADTP